MRLEDYKKKDPFATPEGYFAKLNSNILKATCGNSLPQEKRKKVSLVSRMRWVGYAAMIAIIATVAAGIISVPGTDWKKGNAAEALFHEAVSRLPAKQRLTFNMKYYEEMKYEEMSALLDTSVGALKASYHIAVKKIEEFLKENN